MKSLGSASWFFTDWIVWTAFVYGVGTSDLTVMLLAVLAAGTVGVARKDWEQGRRPFDKIDSL